MGILKLRIELFGGTVPPNNTHAGGTVPPNNMHAGGTSKNSKGHPKFVIHISADSRVQGFCP